ncbi:Transcriptional regulators, LysR family [plant metagenome]|uniref:Transcriptional regulators, LysR family n=2 Tax=root TaxID=1 RepID=A0A1C3K129_9BURK|nr:LysR family transcriptional regulator [Orrella dioscoreae]SBT25087.1 Transcriptional regulators, LysR family [Orrella dioscoreae]SOE50835.1 Transcriptional regulators, LysR family [Orrella dioscoreae]
MNLSPRQLKIFVSLAHSLNFSQTADAFCVTQPTMSKLIREIEEEVGARLFERTTRSVQLTPEGDALLEVATRVSNAFEQGITELEEVARNHAQRLSVAALPTLAAMLLPPLVRKLREQTPNAFIRVHDVFTDTALDLLRTRQADLALTGLDVIHKDLAYEEILQERFVLLSRREDARPGGLDAWSVPALDALPLIAMPQGTGTRRVVETAFLKKGVAFRPVMELRNLNAIGKFVKAGCGHSLLPLSGAELILDETLAITPLRGAPERTLGIATRREAGLPALAEAMIVAVREAAWVRQARPEAPDLHVPRTSQSCEKLN